MSTELNKKQSEKGDDFLKKLISDGNLGRQAVYDFFNSRDEAVFVCKKLEQKGLVILVGETYNDSFTLVNPEEGISTFLKNGGLTKEYKNSKKHFTRYQMIYLIGFFIFGLLGAYKILFPSVSESEFKTLKSDFDSLNSKLDSLVKSTKVKEFSSTNDTIKINASD